MSSNQDYLNTLQLFDSTSLARLDLAFATNTAEDDSFGCFRNGLLKAALAKPPHLQSISINLNMAIRMSELGQDQNDAHSISLQDVFPTPHQQHLPHL